MDANLLTLIGSAVVSIVVPILTVIIARKKDRDAYILKEKEMADQRKTIEAEAAKVVSETYNQLISNLRTQMDKVEKDQKALEDQLATLSKKAEQCSLKISRFQEGIQRLINQLKEAGLMPVWEISPEDKEK